MEHYAAVKERLVAGVQAGGTAVIGVDDDWCAAAAERVAAAGKTVVAHFGAQARCADGIYAENGEIIRAIGGKTQSIARLDGIGSLRGVHNAQNAACAAAAVLALGLDAAAIQQGPAIVSRAWRIAWSRSAARARCCSSTTPRRPTRIRAAQALASFPDMFWIAGGKPKTGGITSLEKFFPRIRKAYLIGEAAADFARRSTARSPYEMAGTLDRAVEAAAARCGGVRAEGAGGAAVAGLRVVRPVPRISRCAATVSANWCWRCRESLGQAERKAPEFRRNSPH